jgi:multiple RNA-binding domain-containing protein 1
MSGSRICVKNLGKNTNEKQLKDHFGTKGEVTDVRIVKTKSGKSRQLAFLGFRTDVQAQEAITYFNNTFLETARIIVESAKKIGDQSLIDNARSKITKKKLEKASKEQALESEKLKKEVKLAAKNKLLTKDKSTKEKRDFMEAMKPRRNTQFWANDG